MRLTAAAWRWLIALSVTHGVTSAAYVSLTGLRPILAFWALGSVAGWLVAVSCFPQYRGEHYLVRAVE